MGVVVLDIDPEHLIENLPMNRDIPYTYWCTLVFPAPTETSR
jgi:hypothetical protein